MAGLAIGSYTLEARAYDNSGNTANSSITVNVTSSGTTRGLPWIEQFSQANGTKTGVGATTWQAIRSPGIMSVQNGKLVINGAGSVGVLTTGTIDISSGPVKISLDLISQGALETNQDYVRLYKKVNGGAEVLVGEKLGNQPATIITGNSITGSTLQLVIRSYVSAGDEFYYLDNLSVSAQ